MRVILTRPEREAQRWAELLQARGHAAVPLPLIGIGPAPDLSAVQAALRRLPAFDAVMFVSANAVAGFLQSDGAAARTDWAVAAIKTRAWATGPGTAQALAEAGVPPGCVDQPPPDGLQFDSEALWGEVQGQVRPGTRVLIVRGAGADGEPAGRDWLATRLQQAGAQVDTVAAYSRSLPAWTPAQQQGARHAAGDGSVWLFSSSEAVANLRALLPAQDWSRARALATHERIAQAAREAGFGVVWPSRASVEAIVATLESIG